MPKGLNRKERSQVKRLASAAVLRKSEKKYLISESGGIAVTTVLTNTANMIQLSDVDQGDQVTQRSGDVIYGDSVRFRGTMIPNSTTPEAATMRALIFSTNRAEADWDDHRPNYYQCPSQDFLSHVNKIYLDKNVNLPSAAMQDTPVPAEAGRRSFDWSFSLHGLKIEYQDGTGSNGGKNQIYLALVSDESTNAPTLAYSAKFSFRDP